MADTYTDEIGEKICEHVAAGLSVKKIVAKLGGEPCEATVYNWLLKHKEFEEKFFHAKRIYGIARAEQISDLGQTAIDAACGVPDPEGKVADPKRINAIVNAINNQVQNEKWNASHLYREKYGDKVQHTGGDGDGPVQIVVTRVGSK
jgi:hypothetical protein